MNQTEIIVWAMFSAVMIAVVYAYLMQMYVSKLAGKLIENKKNSKEEAVSLDELGYKSKFSKALTEFFVSGGWTLSKAIVKVGGEKVSGTDPDLLFVKKSEVKYYIPEENITKKTNKHINEKTSLVKLIALLVILTFVACFASRIIDFLGNYAYGLVNGDKKGAIGVEKEDDSLLAEQEELNKYQQELDAIEAELEMLENGNAEE